MSCLLITLNKCLKGHKSLGLLLGGVLNGRKSPISKVLSQSVTMSPIELFSMSSICLSLCLFVDQVTSPHHSDQMSQRSQVSRIAPFGCSLMEVHR